MIRAQEHGGDRQEERDHAEDLSRHADVEDLQRQPEACRRAEDIGAASSARRRRHRAMITMAMAIQPAPAVISSCHDGISASVKYAPPNPRRLLRRARPRSAPRRRARRRRRRWQVLTDGAGGQSVRVLNRYQLASAAKIQVTYTTKSSPNRIGPTTGQSAGPLSRNGGSSRWPTGRAAEVAGSTDVARQPDPKSTPKPGDDLVARAA